MVFDNANHPVEHKIKLLLGMKGYDKKEMRFKNGSDGRTLQYGHKAFTLGLFGSQNTQHLNKFHTTGSTLSISQYY